MKRLKTHRFYRRIAPGVTEDPQCPWPRLSLEHDGGSSIMLQ
jgi:hypothetical protein